MESTASTNSNEVFTAYVEKETIFLGIKLDSEEIRLALYVQFGLTIFLFVVCLIAICTAFVLSNKAKKLLMKAGVKEDDYVRL